MDVHQMLSDMPRPLKPRRGVPVQLSSPVLPKKAVSRLAPHGAAMAAPPPRGECNGYGVPRTTSEPPAEPAPRGRSRVRAGSVVDARFDAADARAELDALRLQTERDWRLQAVASAEEAQQSAIEAAKNAEMLANRCRQLEAQLQEEGDVLASTEQEMVQASLERRKILREKEEILKDGHEHFSRALELEGEINRLEEKNEDLLKSESEARSSNEALRAELESAHHALKYSLFEAQAAKTRAETMAIETQTLKGNLKKQEETVKQKEANEAKLRSELLQALRAAGGY